MLWTLVKLVRLHSGSDLHQFLVESVHLITIQHLQCLLLMLVVQLLQQVLLVELNRTNTFILGNLGIGTDIGNRLQVDGDTGIRWRS